MGVDYAGIFSGSSATQFQEVPGKGMVRNSSGAFSMEVSKWTRMRRFLVLGTEGGSYYANEQSLTMECGKCIVECASEDFDRALAMVVDVSDRGLAAKNDQAVFALSILCCDKSEQNRRKAMDSIGKVCRIGTHLLMLVKFVKSFRGVGGSGMRRALADWYLSKTPREVLFQATKYANREGFTHRDVLRMIRPKVAGDMDGVFAYITDKDWSSKLSGEARVYAEALQNAKVVDEDALARLILDFNLPREVIPTEKMNSVKVWQALLDSGMGASALLRNLGKMSSLGMLGPMSDNEKAVRAKFENEHWIRKSRLHPFAILYGAQTYRSGRGVKGSLSWDVNLGIIDSLEKSYYAAFENVEPTGKNYMIGLDVSGSMNSLIGGTAMSCRSAAAALAMVTVRTEPYTHTVAFSNGIIDFPVSKSDSLGEIVRRTNGLPFSSTDCALPMLYAQQRKIPVDVFVIYTDSETNANSVHPYIALKQYRQSSGRNAKLVVVGMVANKFSIADPTDPGMLDVVGMSPDTPKAIAEFVRE